MRAIVTGSYKKINKSGKLVTMFRCKVSGTEAEIADYKATQGENYREDENTKEPLFFTDRPIGKQFGLVKTRGSEGKPARYIVDDSELALQKAIAEQAGGNLGQEIARIAAGQFMFSTPAASTAASVNTPAPEVKDDLNNA